MEFDSRLSRYNLGPNGGILTSLNLFATKIDQIIGLLEKRTRPDPSNPARKPMKHILVDTPGQIEVFVWSASGSILLDSLASSFPTVLAYVIDTPRTSSTSTFMSNMLYACSILYKTKLPMILVFNKTDVRDAAFAKEWMTDFEAFQAALRQEEQSGSFGGLEGGDSFGGGGGGGGGGSGYMGSLLNSMSLMLEEFYRHLSVVAVSSVTGRGVDDFFHAVDAKVDEFQRDYRPELERRRQQREKSRTQQRDQQLGKLMRDLRVTSSSAGGSGSGVGGPARQRRKGPKREEPETISDAEEEDANEDERESRRRADAAHDEGEEYIPAEMVEPDDDEEVDEGGGKRAGGRHDLTDRYAEALHGGKQPMSESDKSFARYLRASAGGSNG
jgi:hypothetical protein